MSISKWTTVLPAFISAEDQNREVHSVTDSPMLENPALVPNPVGTADGFSNPAAQAQEPTEESLTTNPIHKTLRLRDSILQSEFLSKLQNC